MNIKKLNEEIEKVLNEISDSEEQFLYVIPTEDGDEVTIQLCQGDFDNVVDEFDAKCTVGMKDKDIIVLVCRSGNA